MRAIDADQLYEFFRQQRAELIYAYFVNSDTEYISGRLAEISRIMRMLKDERFTPTIKDAPKTP